MTLLNETLIKLQGLNVRRIRLHQKRILQALHHEINTDIAIQNTCTLDNKGILSFDKIKLKISLEWDELQNWQKKHVVSCIPAAGAASRFFIEIQNFVNVMSNLLEFGLPIVASDLLLQFPFLDKLSYYALHKPKLNSTSLEELYHHCLELIKKYALKPKLMVPATKEGHSFLELKIEEQEYLFPCLGNTLIIPNEMKKEIQSFLRQLKPKELDKWFILEQDKKLSSIRFLRNGEPYLNEKNEYSVVSAGHGELLHLFNDITKQYPQAQCLHIRNIDNIIGTNDEQKLEINIPNLLFYKMREILELVRSIIPTLNMKTSTTINNEQLNKKLNFVYDLLFSKEEILKIPSSLSSQFLYQLFVQLFYWPKLSSELKPEKIWKLILEYAEKPLSVFGVVQKEKGDVGGGPVFAEVSQSGTIKLCMEMPHANSKDAEEFFSHTGKSTHFNPALVFFELKTHTQSKENDGKKVNFVQLFDERFWLLTKREYKGTPVCYHETVLYELIGNSSTTNLVFVEVPRSLFKPHKSYLNCLEHDRKTYGFNKDSESNTSSTSPPSLSH